MQQRYSRSSTDSAGATTVTEYIQQKIVSIKYTDHSLRFCLLRAAFCLARLVYVSMTSNSDSKENNCVQNFSRTLYSQPEFDKLYLRYDEEKPTAFLQKSAGMLRKVHRRACVSYCGATTEGGFCKQLLRFFYRFFAFLEILRNYDGKSWLANDLITGFTIGVMHVPQGMAYAMLATLPPVHGLYCSMCASFFYFFLGTSRHLSLGTLAILSLLVGSCLDRNVPQSLLLPNKSSESSDEGSSSMSDADNVADRVFLASALAMTVGIMQLIMGLLRLGFLTRLLSRPMLAGFTVGSSVYVGISQLFVVFGLHLKKHTGIFNAPLNFYSICANLPNANWVTFGLSISCMAVLYIFQLFINPQLRVRIKVPVPVELLVIIIGGIISYYLQLGKIYSVRVVGTVPTGFPQPIVPRLSVAGGVIGDAFVIALIGFSLSYSLASFYSYKEGYKVNPNQELVAYGITNISSSFFTAYPVGASISRTALVATMGGKSQIVGLVASIFVLLVVLFAGPLFYDVPNCCLSAIILVALRGMVAQLLELPILWRYSTWDFASWVVAFAATVFLDVLYGLIIGVAFSALVVFVRSQFSKAFAIGRFDSTELFKPSDVYTSCAEDPKVKVIRYEGGLFYAGAELFSSSVIDATGFDPRPLAFRKKKLDVAVSEADVVLSSKAPDYDSAPSDQEDIQLSHLPLQEMQLGEEKCGSDGVGAREGRVSRCRCSCACGNCRHYMSRLEAMSKKQEALNQLSDLLSSVPLTHVILDCSAWTFIDIVGANTLQGLIDDYNEVGVEVYLASPSREIYNSLTRSGLFEKFDRSVVYVSVKSVATKLIVNPDATNSGFGDKPDVSGDPNIFNETESETRKSNREFDMINDQPVFSTDATGNIVLSDGTPVVQPAGVEETQGCSFQFDLQDGVLPRKSLSCSFQIGGVDTVRCTSCAVRISPFACAMHPHLSVIVCKRCLKFYGKGEFARDVDGKDENLIIFKVFERIKSLKEQAKKRAELKRNRLPIPITPKASGKAVSQPAGKPSQDSSKVPAAAKTSSSCPSGISNTCEWYLKNMSVAEILNQISSIHPPIIRPVIQSLRFCVETFSNDIKRVETSLSRARTPEEVQEIVCSFQNIYRFHLLGRIANVVSQVNVDLRNKASSCSSQTSKLTDTIDLTDDLEPAVRPSNGHHPPEPRRRRGSAANSASSTSPSKKRRKTLANSAVRFRVASSALLSSSVSHEATGVKWTSEAACAVPDSAVSTTNALRKLVMRYGSWLEFDPWRLLRSTCAEFRSLMRDSLLPVSGLACCPVVQFCNYLRLNFKLYFTRI
ncbi:Prestin [Taenia crassiceps]|uniref:Prestin n=1 Tax=Taenia crassiceps TaxID=6207 RepID=A0ABR4QNL6_9CEST